MTRFNTRFSDGDVTAELYMYDGMVWRRPLSKRS